MDKVTYVSRSVMDRYHDKVNRKIARQNQRILALEAKLIKLEAAVRLS